MPFPSRSKTLPVQHDNPFYDTRDDLEQHRSASSLRSYASNRSQLLRRISFAEPLPHPQDDDHQLCRAKEDNSSITSSHSSNSHFKSSDSHSNLSDSHSNLSDSHSNPSDSHSTSSHDSDDDESTVNHPEDNKSTITSLHPHRHRRLPIRQRIQHFTWAWYTLSMSTGSLSVLIYNQTYQFWGLRQVGFGIYVLNIVFFVLVTAGLITRFLLFRGSFKTSITHKREGFFCPTLLLSIATLITSTDRYVVSQGNNRLDLGAVQWSFWAYLVVSTVVAVGQYAFVFSRHRMRPFRNMMPTWILPIFPVMLTGTIASVIADTQPEIAAVPIIVAGLTCQGLGLSVAGMMYALMMGRLFFAGLPDREHRPGLFMCVGPPAFTALALVGMGNGLPQHMDFNFDGVADVLVLRTLAVVGAVFLWALSFWWFGVAAVAVVMAPPRYFHLGWWAAIFPNSGFTLATIALGRAMDSQPIKDVATFMSAVVGLAYLFVLVSLIRAVWLQDIMYPGRDEDFDSSVN